MTAVRTVAPHTAGGTPVLELQNVHSYYGQIEALKGLNMTVNEGEIVALIGGNGAGKTTTLRTISGMMKPKTGSVTYLGQNVTGVPSHQLIGRGMAHVPEGRRIFPQMTVRENLEVGAYTVNDKAAINARIEEGFELFPRLRERESQLGGTMSGGEQQMLAIARALMIAPKVLLLDEPSMGLSPLFVENIFSIIERLNKERGTTILLVEQNASMALAIADRAYVLQTGEIKLSGNAQDIARDETVRKAYLGDE
ncbi:ABC transporter ATP-binding protein [Deinococcus radiodurans]|jgi:amino acid/amide ABC transporter ATP-binding protein 2, HAAT family (TC 3.A.1.4.-)|uniref:Branched-chain amino acid ABC transporter, ATP-binding protein n=1 Tax=Deinococcus radiodurans (strain ATCC 13939 / DSM 20539 / JCM 16871 / CCUG 27074 / LMG 4051 / NBRC 15346 / NCIMB 9279 / VKM B-1422 / R1) TaxID=243230 RepID=Q9RVJ4_DEIRA|nr:ABC transporter ATP-binding protein [Deinococcus radiodurans]AAF10610.1 branched-chain amino acid ABC transporter, ATP-binding protein [Deinococcus radiodurans R1 = ATCC 13939 = DSM 20539]ANC71783.1 ABC transporter ATP-binding protein [Deinococcus radiodurans R1 = ATCC 13939 = DSM 20539]QEM70524.1 ABC transporter ATP-binding protein [Deinococcus radiodurans]QIP29128.1 ABC transporter ATP-binding protein [Deinococcus radiodurans]QIP32174.1 ABC transporter ATP-binding protein [Deinococcus rad